MIQYYTCDGCGTKDLQNFMLLDEVWAKVAKKDQTLCIECAEKRLSRRITLHDLRPCLMSDTMILGAYFGQATEEKLDAAFLLRPYNFKLGYTRYNFPDAHPTHREVAQGERGCGT